MYQAEIITQTGKKVVIKKTLNDLLFDEHERPIDVKACTKNGRPFRDFEFFDEWQKQPALLVYLDRQELWRWV